MLPEAFPMLPFGNGRSYGDVCLNKDGVLLATRGLDRFIAFDHRTGVLECEAGTLLNDIIELALPHGWFLPVSPGTSFVTTGGAIANDVHGKNHHRVGSFCNHLLEFELLRSDGRSIDCTPRKNAEWFSATAGGLGLTGLIRRAKLQLRRVPGPWIRGDSHRFFNLREFAALARESDVNYEYTVAWLDCAALGSNLGRGVFMRGNHSPEEQPPSKKRSLRLPFAPPFSLVNRLSLAAFNQYYFHRRAAERTEALWDFREFFYPLDRISNWNCIYGPKGFLQYQCVVPEADAVESLEQMLKLIARSGLGSFLAVLKIFGGIRSLGMMSFPRAGATLALDFQNRDQSTLSLLESLDAITRAAGGAVYPAKDARMSATSFRQYFPMWEQFQQFVDPRFSSSFWRRVTAAGI
jgi:FAD/FMN-containing dehydrogenase